MRSQIKLVLLPLPNGRLFVLVRPHSPAVFVEEIPAVGFRKDVILRGEDALGVHR